MNLLIPSERRKGITLNACLICCLLTLGLSCNNHSGLTDASGFQEAKMRKVDLAGNPEAVIIGEKVNSLSQSLLPFQFDIKSAAGVSSPMTLIDILYCEAENPTQAKLLAIGHPGPPPPKRPTRVLTKDDCKATLDSIAQKALSAKDSPDWVVASYITVNWTTWELKLTVRDAATAVKTGATNNPPADLKSQLQNGGKPFKSLKTSDMQFTIEGSVEVFNLALQFIDRNIFVMMVPAAQVPSFDMSAFLAHDTSLAKISVPEQTGLIAQLPYSFTSNLLNTDLKDKEIILQTSSGGNPTLTVRNLGVSGGKDTFTTTGRVKYTPEKIEANASINWQGTDLKLKSVNLDAILDSCQGLPPVQKFKCEQTLKLKASLAAGEIMKRYKDTPLRPIGPGKQIPIQLDGKYYNLRFITLQSQSTPIALILYLDFILEAA